MDTLYIQNIMKRLLMIAAVLATLTGCRKDDGKVIALTFDDGPNTTTTVKMLDILEKHGITASFFVNGMHINEESAKVMKRAYDMGCDIENHSFSHLAMSSLSDEDVIKEIESTSALIEKYTGEEPKFFRPPYIAYNERMMELIPLTFICGNGCEDWLPEVSAEERAQRQIEAAVDGGIILMHDFEGNEATAEALDILIPALKEQGYRFVTVAELFELKKEPLTPHNGIIYSSIPQ